MWGVNRVSLNHFMTDTPLWYDTPIGPPVGITVSYNSQAGVSGDELFGNKWVFNYGGYIVEDAGGDVTVHMPDGAEHTYTSDGQGGYIAPEGIFDTLVKIDDRHYELRFLDGGAYVYDIPLNINSLIPYLVEIVDPYGQKLSIGYDFDSRLSTIRDALGRDTALSYNAAGYIANVVDPFGRSAHFEYDTDGNLTKITDMKGYWASFTYDGDSYMTGMSNERGTWGFDTEEPTGFAPSDHSSYPEPGGVMSNKHRLTITDPHGGKEEYFYTSRDNPGDELSTWHVSPNDYVEYRSEGVNNMTSAPKTRYVIPEGTLQNDVIGKVLYPNEEEADASYELFDHYQTNGKIANSTDIHGHENHYTYTSKGLINSVTYPNGETVTYGYDPNGVDLTSVTTGLGTATFTYNANHSIINATDMEGVTTNFSYNGYGQVTAVTSALGTADESLTEFIYNTTTHLADERRVDGSTVSAYTYDSKDRVRTATDATGMTLTYDYDDLDQVTKITYPDGRYVEYTYSSCCPGQIESVKDRSGRTSYYAYDALKRLKEVRAPGAVTRFEYDRNGNVTKLTDTKGTATQFEYDLMGRVFKKTYADTKYATLDTDDAGLILNTVGAGGVTTTFGYDSMDNVTSISYSDTTPSVSLIYDSYGRVTSRADGTGTFGFGYDANNNVTIVNGPWAGDNVSYDYDDLGRIKTVTPEGGQTATYTYDSLGRTGTVQFGTDTFTYIYNGASPLVEGMIRPDGSKTDYLYDGQLKRLTDVINRDDTSTVINSFGYTYNNMDLKENETITRGAPITTLSERNITYNYSNVNQVTDSTNPARTYTHEDDGGMTRGYTPDGYPFDAVYDAEGRLISLQYTDSGSVLHRTEYTYGGDDLLYEIRKFEDGTPTDTTRIVRAGFLPIQERDENNNVVREYVWGPSMGGGIGGLLAMKQDGNVYYYLYDGKGNVTALTDSSGNVVATYTYNPFGVLTESSGSLDQPFRFSTKRYDEETGLSYYGYRFYSASLGRWMTRDPLGEAGGVNLYGFVGNNSINGVDPLGLVVDTVADIGFIGYDIYAILADNVFGDEDNLGTNLAALGADVCGAFTPFATGLGMTVRTVKGVKGVAKGAHIIEGHHLLPVQFKKKFAVVGLNIEDYIYPMTRGAHRLKVYDGLHTGANHWNLQWKIFFKTNKKYTRKKVLNQLQKMKLQSGLL